MAAPPITLVTGGTRGLGRETCRQLAQLGHHVILGARRPADAQRVAAALSVEPITLDVEDAGSVQAAVQAVRARHGRLDNLVNNAGVALDGFDAEVVRRTLAVNVHGVRTVTHAFAPLLPQGGTVVMVSSGMGDLSILGSGLRRAFEDPELGEEGLVALLDGFVEAVESGTHGGAGWPSSAYSVSKAALNTLTRILARSFAGRGIRVNAVCPGWVRTDMGGAGAPRGVEEGAASIVWAATLPPDGPSGGFFRDGRAIDW